VRFEPVTLHARHRTYH